MAQRGTTYPPPLLKVYEPTLSNEQTVSTELIYCTHQ